MRDLVKDFHDQGVKVLWPYAPWDQGTNACPFDVANPLEDDCGTTVRPDDIGALVDLLDAVEADGFNGDTMPGIGQQWLQQTLQSRPDNPLVLEPQHPISIINDQQAPLDLQFNVLSWSDRVFIEGLSFSPLLSKYRAIEGRHQGHVCNRADRNRTEVLQSSLFNGMGYEVWENVW